MTRMDKFNNYLGALKRWDAFVARVTRAKSTMLRSYFADRWIRGDGVEIGPQCNPLRVNNGGARIKYVDRLLPESISAIHGLPVESLVRPDIVLDADSMSGFSDGSLDFIVANHLLEHMENPIRALEEWLRVLRTHGILFLSVPNYRSNEYDFTRQPVSVDHCIAVHKSTSAEQHTAHKMAHWREFVAQVDDIPENDPRFPEWVRRYAERDDRIHFHVFDAAGLTGILRFIHETSGRGMLIRDYFGFHFSFEYIYVIEKCAASSDSWSDRTLARQIRNMMLLFYTARRG